MSKPSVCLFGSLLWLALGCRAIDPVASVGQASLPPVEAKVAAPRFASPPDSSPRSSSQLSRFEDESELRRFLDRNEALGRVLMDRILRRGSAGNGEDSAGFDGVEETITTGSEGPGSVLLPPTTSAIAFDVASYSPNLSVSDVGSITNNQERGVDEGDIVKRIGEHLIVLRRGRLHSIWIGDRAGDSMRLVDVQDVFPFASPHEAWYDELLVDGNRIVVLGYSYETGATELSIFDLDRHGRIRHQASHAIRSGDYYSGENYGSRLVDRRLVIYAPIGLEAGADSATLWPSYSTWGSDGLDRHWKPLVEEIEILRPVQNGLPTTLHALIECELEASGLACRARALVGGWSAIHYVSASAAYLWIRGSRARFDPTTIEPEAFSALLAEEDGALEFGGWWSRDPGGLVYRIPFDGSAIGAVEVEGAPSNQFAFREAGGALDLFLVRETRGWDEPDEAHWSRIPISDFERPLGDPLGVLDWRLPDLIADWTCRDAQRFVADHLLYANCRRDDRGTLEHGVHAVTLESDPASEFVGMPGPVTRIEPVDQIALVVGGDSSGADERDGTHLLPIRLSHGVDPAVPLHLPQRVEIENRSHAFNWVRRNDELLMGLPLARLPAAPLEEASMRASSAFTEPPSVIAWFTLDDGARLARVGELAERRPSSPPPEDCETSCYDWYGSVRPIFLDDRLFGLIGDELVEGRLVGQRVRELQRLRIQRRQPIR